MTFDTSYDNMPQRSHSATEKQFDSLPTRPELRSSMTTPAGVGAGAGAVGGSAVGALALEPNAWAEHDVGDGGEGEIEMSFE